MEKIEYKKSRAFNNVVIDKKYGVVSKASSDIDKLVAEYEWYQKMPRVLQGLVPKAISKPTEYSPLILEYCPHYTLSEAFTNSRLSLDWESVLYRLIEVHEMFQEVAVPNNLYKDVLDFHIKKTQQRVSQLRSTNEMWAKLMSLKHIQINGRAYRNIDDFIFSLLERQINNRKPSVVHGDYCLSNILYDFDTQSVKLIDPRGYLLNKKEPTIFGDSHYDYAKLMHSVEGLYDFIVQGKYSLICHSHDRYDLYIGLPAFNHEALVKILDSESEEMGALEYRKILQVLLFLTMIPLHYDDQKRQVAFYLRAVQLYNDLI